jgi:hypothetical protein
MPRGFWAQISHNEQRVLVSLSLQILPREATSSEFEHLMKLDLIEVRHGAFHLTSLGRERLNEAALRPRLANTPAEGGAKF